VEWYSSKGHVGKHLPNAFPIQNCLKHGNALSPLLSHLASEYIITKAQESVEGQKLNGTRKLLVYADGLLLFLLGQNKNTTKKLHS
jgi:hypothetical protein